MDQELMAATAQGMALAYHASQSPEQTAVVTSTDTWSFAALNARVNQLARLLREHDVGPGDAIAIVTKNRHEFVEAFFAGLRTGVRITPVNWHLSAEETGYIVDNCEAKAVIYDATLETGVAALDFAPACQLKLAVGGAVEGFEDYELELAKFDSKDIGLPVRGTQMLYTSGTTGRPKGVYRKEMPTARSNAQALMAGDAQNDKCLCTGPAYHAAPLAFNVISPLNAGIGIVMMDKWDPLEALRLIEAHKITHTHMVATMFHRLLALTEQERNRYDLSSLEVVLHGAAPCPVHIKKAMIEWLGPVIVEYYAATEGGNNFIIDSATWLQKPGSVGRSPDPDRTKILDDDGEPVAVGMSGTIYFKAPEVGRFEYFKAEEKTSESYSGDWFTLGDMGYFDEDGYLYLNGRSAETIISGGVNIYPQQIDEQIGQHEAVFDVCTVGVPSDEWGEAVKSIVQLHPDITPSDDLAEDILAFAREKLPGYQQPRSVDFVESLPRLPSGKIQRRIVREPYWKDRKSKI